MQQRDWFKVQLKDKGKDEAEAEILVDDFIGDWIDNYWGFGVTAKAFVSELAAMPDEVKSIKVRINSPGGDVFAAAQIANALRQWASKCGRTVETYVEGLAASAASVIAMAGAPVKMADNSLMMIHEPWSGAVGNAGEMRKAADVLDQVRDTIVATYRWHTDKTEEEIVALLEAETWMNADEAIEAGFADEKVEGLRAAASIDPKALDTLKVPERYAARVKAFLRAEDEPTAPEPPAPTPEPEKPAEPAPEPAADAAEVVSACASAGLDVAAVQAIVTSRPTMAAAKAAIDRWKADREAEHARAESVRAACAVAGLGDLSEHMVGLGCGLEPAKALLVELRARLDVVELDSSISPDHGAKRKPVIDTVALYAQRNGLRTEEK
jgi:ATP-dependent protease ClpP protease subunit